MKPRTGMASIAIGIAAIMIVLGIVACGGRVNQNTQPPAPQGNAPIQQPGQAQPGGSGVNPPAGATTQNNQAAPPPAGTVSTPDPQGAEIDQLLNQLDSENNSADTLTDVP